MSVVCGGAVGDGGEGRGQRRAFCSSFFFFLSPLGGSERLSLARASLSERFHAVRGGAPPF